MKIQTAGFDLAQCGLRNIAHGSPSGLALTGRVRFTGMVSLNPIRLVLLVAQDEMVRRSLEFVIQSEGIFVDSHQLLSLAIESPLLKKADCSVIDEDAVNSPQAALEYLPQLPGPVILLAEQPERHDAISRSVPIHILVKPLPGSILIETLRRLQADMRH